MKLCTVDCLCDFSESAEVWLKSVIQGLLGTYVRYMLLELFFLNFFFQVDVMHLLLHCVTCAVEMEFYTRVIAIERRLFF